MKLPLCLAMVGPLFTRSFARDASLKKALQDRYTQLSRAFAAKDKKGFESAFAADFTAKSPGRGLLSRSEVLRDFEAQMMTLSNVRWRQTITQLKPDGKLVHVVIDSEMDATVPGQNGAKHKFRLETKGTKSDWIKSGKGWQVKYSESGNLKMWMDGTPMSRG